MALTQQWAKAFPVVHFSVMHPGWVDTQGTAPNTGIFIILNFCKRIADIAVSSRLFSMLEFHKMMDGRLRSVDQGADTAVWLALCRTASRTSSAQFFF